VLAFMTCFFLVSFLMLLLVASLGYRITLAKKLTPARGAPPPPARAVTLWVLELRPRRRPRRG
ncbi:hypothetical protein AB0C77_22100, partial [Streptomyces sp. NPDC048629]|uniref:hypothetical protein n=1 Tax=Streptomyces sp. NPDC048629 TaxID=3154824 RepID=UPI003446CAA1